MPGRTIPRAVLISIAIVAALYLALNAAVLAVLPWRPLLAMTDLSARQALISLLHADGVCAGVRGCGECCWARWRRCW